MRIHSRKTRGALLGTLLSCCFPVQSIRAESQAAAGVQDGRAPHNDSNPASAEEGLRDWTAARSKSNSAWEHEPDASRRDVSASFGQGGITIEDEQADLKVEIGGRLHFDAGGCEGHGKDLDEQSLWRGRLRRAWLEFSFSEGDLHGQLQLAPWDRSEAVKSAILGYAGAERLSLSIGNMKVPFGLENLESSNTIPFMERSLSTALLPGRAFGVAAGMHGDQWSLVGGLFGGNINGEIDQAAGFAARATYAIGDTKHGLLHLGLSGGFQSLSSETPFEVSPYPESRTYDVSLIGTDRLRDVQSLARAAVESAYVKGSLRFQSEFAIMSADRNAPLDRDMTGERRDRAAATLFGGYLQASAILTGQTYKYDVAPDPEIGVGYGIFGGVDLDENDTVSRGGSGAWEVAARASLLDLSELDGGRERNVGFGLNWYPEKNIRFMAEAIRAFVDPGDGTERVRQNVTILQGRIQVAF